MLGDTAMKKNVDSFTDQLENRLEEHKKKVYYSQEFIQSLCDEFRKNNYIEPFNYEKYNVKRGLRNADGTGVMAGVTRIGSVEGYVLRDGERVPQPGSSYTGALTSTTSLTDSRLKTASVLKRPFTCCFSARCLR
jgi:hypothetical protein